MKKILLFMLLACVSQGLWAQYDYYPNGKDEVPVLGMQWGVFGGGYTAMLNNRDDIDADQRLDPQMMNFNWGAGIEGIYWLQRNIGFGAQAMYWNAGAKYTGVDTNTKIHLSATTKLTYAKLPILFHFKSYNRYHPNRRTRFNAYFGPYVALLQTSSDEVRYTKEDDPNFSQYWNFDNGNYSTDGLTGAISGKLYKPADVGFVVAIGGEVRLWRKTVVAVHVRADIGVSDIEDKRVKTIEYSNGLKDTNYVFYSGNYAKYIPPGAAEVLNNWQPNRPATKNFSMGAFLSLRKYFGDKK
ncbi:MAG: hypothetical protein R2831_00675 [Chitinophagaceae bacterium]